LGVLVPTNTKLTHVFGSKVLVLVLVCYKLTLTPPCKHEHYVVIISKKRRGRDKIKSKGNGKRFPKIPKTVNGETVASQWLRAPLQR
jgi:hypothetical protein